MRGIVFLIGSTEKIKNKTLFQMKEASLFFLSHKVDYESG